MSVRKSIPHLLPPKPNSPCLTDQQVLDLIEPGKIGLYNVTEKTDGQAFVIGYDKDGFFTQSSGSGKERMRQGNNYIERAKLRNNSIKVANALSIFHDNLSNNNMLLDFLLKSFLINEQEIILNGEIFNNLLARRTEEGLSKYIHIPYDSSTFGTIGHFVLHSRITKFPNKVNPLKEWMLKEFNTDTITFDWDLVYMKMSISVRDLLDNKNICELRKEIHKRLFNIFTDPRYNTRYFKWGPYTEGFVFHHHWPTNPKVPTFKVISDYFTKARETTPWAEISA